MSEFKWNGFFLIEDVLWKLTVVLVFYILAVNWHTPVHMLLILPVWSDQSIFPCGLLSATFLGFLLPEMLCESCPFFPKSCSRICAGLWIKVSCSLGVSERGAVQRSGSRGWTGGTPSTVGLWLLVEILCNGDSVCDLVFLQSCGQRWAVWDIGPLECSALLYSRKKG